MKAAFSDIISLFDVNINGKMEMDEQMRFLKTHGLTSDLDDLEFIKVAYNNTDSIALADVIEMWLQFRAGTSTNVKKRHDRSGNQDGVTRGVVDWTYGFIFLPWLWLWHVWISFPFNSSLKHCYLFHHQVQIFKVFRYTVYVTFTHLKIDTAPTSRKLNAELSKVWNLISTCRKFFVSKVLNTQELSNFERSERYKVWKLGLSKL